MTMAKSLRDNKISADNYKKTVDSLIESLASLDSLIAAVVAINQSGFQNIIFSSEQQDEIKRSIADCGNACSGHSLSQAHVSALSAVLEKYYQQVTTVWQAEAKERAASIESYITALLSLLDSKVKAEAVLKDLREGRTQKPSSDVVATYERNLELAHSIADGYKLTPEVKSFLDKVRVGKATFSDLTDDVNRWISENGMGSKIKISF